MWPRSGGAFLSRIWRERDFLKVAILRIGISDLEFPCVGAGKTATSRRRRRTPFNLGYRLWGKIKFPKPDADRVGRDIKTGGKPSKRFDPVHSVCFSYEIGREQDISGHSICLESHTTHLAYSYTAHHLQFRHRLNLDEERNGLSHEL